MALSTGAVHHCFGFVSSRCSFAAAMYSNTSLSLPAFSLWGNSIEKQEAATAFYDYRTLRYFYNKLGNGNQVIRPITKGTKSI